jgi:hypothetical protein
MNRRMFGFFRHRSQAFKDLLVTIFLALVVFGVSVRFDLFDSILDWLQRHDTWEFHELFTVAIFLVIASAFYSIRRYRELRVQVLRRERAEAEKARLVPELENALADVSNLKKLLPICSHCMKIRDQRGDWIQVDAYMELHYHTRLDGGLCPECARKAYAHTWQRTRG